MVFKLVKLNFILISFLFLSCNVNKSSDSNDNAENSPSTSTAKSESNSDETEIRKLITAWSELDPSLIGGPRELKGITKVQQIEVKEITNSPEGEEAKAVLTFLTSKGQTKRVTYSLNTFVNAWGIAGINKQGCNPYITLDVMDARKQLNIKVQ